MSLPFRQVIVVFLEAANDCSGVGVGAGKELDAYLKIEQPYDCAGSAKNEGLGIALIASIEGTDPTALTGLPLIALTTMLRHCGVSLF